MRGAGIIVRIIKIILGLCGVLIALAIVAFIAAVMLIPAERSFTNEVDINAPAGKVWQVVVDRGKYTEWQTNLTRVEVTDEKNWVEYPKDSPEPLKFIMSKDERPNRMEFDYTMGDSFAGKWTGELTPTANGVSLKTVDSYAAKSWLTKILIYIFFDYDKFAKDWNKKLKQRVEKLDQ